MLVLLLSLLSFADINLDEVGIYDPRDLRIYRFGGDFLLISYRDPALVRVRDGKKIAEYRKAGQGPDELSFPVVLGFSNREFFILSNTRHILRFGEDLRPLPQTLPPLPPKIAGNIWIDGREERPNQFKVIHSGFTATNSHLVSSLQWQKNRWTLEGRYFPRPPHPGSMNHDHPKDTVRLFNGQFFRFQSIIWTGNDHYQVWVYDVPQSSGAKPIPKTVLQADLEEIRSHRREVRCYLIHALKTKGGFVVEASRGQERYFHDIFDREGKFLRRDHDPYMLIPSQNSKHVFRFDLDSDTIVLDK